MQRTELLKQLRELRRVATMERAHFSHIGPRDERYVPLPTSENEVTPFIRERTHIYRESWLIGPLDEMIEALERGN